MRAMSPQSLVPLNLLILSIGLASPALAQEGEAPAAGPSAPTAPAELFPKQEESPRQWAVTISPMHFALPMLELTAERRLSPTLGVALMMGVGSVTDRDEASGVDNKFNVIELGASARVYGLGRFEKGIQFGGAVEYIRVTGDDINGTQARGIGNGVLVAPFIGYKHTWSFGFTLEGQVGPAYSAIRADSEDGGMEESSSRLTAYLNLNLGWSF